MCLCLPIPHESLESSPCVVLQMRNTKTKVTLDISDFPYYLLLIVEMCFYIAGTMVACLLVEFDRFLLNLVGLSEYLVEIAFDAGSELAHHHSLHSLAYATTQLLHHFVL